MTKKRKRVLTKRKNAGRHPVVSLAAEFLVIGQLMRRNILSYKGPNNYEGYDIISIHPDHKHSGEIVRIQVKSRTSTSGWGFPIKEKSLDGFDFLIFVRLNLYTPKSERKPDKTAISTRGKVEYYTLTQDFVKERHNGSTSYAKVNFTSADKKVMEKFRDEKGFDIIANKLDLAYPDNDSDIE